MDEEVVDDLEKKRFLFLETIGIDMLIDEMHRNDKQLYQKTKGHYFQSKPKNSFYFSEDDTVDAKKSVIKFMQLNHEKYEAKIKNLEPHRFKYKKAKYKVIKNEGGTITDAFMQIKPSITYDDIGFIDRHPLIHEIIIKLRAISIEEKDGVKNIEWILSQEQTDFAKIVNSMYKEYHEKESFWSNFIELIEKIENSKEEEEEDLSVTLRSIIECGANKNRTEFYLKIENIVYEKTTKTSKLIIKYKSEPIPIIDKVNPDVSQELEILVNNRIFEKYGFDCQKRPSDKLYKISDLLNIGLFDPDDIRILLSNSKEKTTRIKILAFVPRHINTDNFIKYESFIKEYIKEYFSEPELVDKIFGKRMGDLLVHTLQHKNCSSMNIVDLFWNDKYPDHAFYFICLLSNFKGLTGGLLDEFLKKYFPKNEAKMLDALFLDHLCTNETVNLKTVLAFISLHKKFNKKDFEFKVDREDTDPLLAVNTGYKDNPGNKRKNELMQIIIYFTEKGVPFKENSELCYSFEIFPFDLEQSLKIINLYVKHVTGVDSKKASDLIKIYKEIESEKSSLVASLCHNKESSFDLLKLLLDNGMNVNKKEDVQYRYQSQGVAIYNVILNSDIKRFKLIINYNLKLMGESKMYYEDEEDEEDEEEIIDCMRFICQCNPTVEFGKIFLEYASKKKIVIPFDCFFYNMENQVKLRPDFLELFFEHKKLTTEEHGELVKITDTDIFESLKVFIYHSDKKQYDQITSQVINVFAKYKIGLKPIEGDDILDVLLMSQYPIDLKVVETLLDNGLKVKVGHIEKVIEKDLDQEVLFSLLKYADLQTISNSLYFIAKMDDTVKAVVRILLRVGLLYREESKENISKFLDKLSKGDKRIPWGFKKGELIKQLVNAEINQSALWNPNIEKIRRSFDGYTKKIFESFVMSIYFLSKYRKFFLGNSPKKIPKPILNNIMTLIAINQNDKAGQIKNINPNSMNNNKRKFEECVLSIPGSNKREKINNSSSVDEEDDIHDDYYNNSYKEEHNENSDSFIENDYNYEDGDDQDYDDDEDDDDDD